MSAYGRLRERYQIWLAKECLPNQDPFSLLLRTDIVSAEQRKELQDWFKQFANTHDD